MLEPSVYVERGREEQLKQSSMKSSMKNSSPWVKGVLSNTPLSPALHSVVVN